MPEKRRAITAVEVETFGRWRRLYCYLQRPGVASSIKRGSRRRERHEARAEIRAQRD